MIKLVMCLCKHPALTRAQFHDYWVNNHGPFFMKNAATMRAKRYVQSHTVETPLNAGMRSSRGMLPEYDGVAEVWFDSEEELMAAMNSPEGQRLSAALLEDEQRFIDHAKSTAFVVREHEFAESS
ncbi:MAG: EthD domain-containing protein [Nitrospira sp.]|nr:EthD domain-containing protein [Nitrospira sp.]